jgi:4-hydroxybutyryl-CoA dehydratase/vinylacetyl-CoA-Delta-isomerase
MSGDDFRPVLRREARVCFSMAGGLKLVDPERSFGPGINAIALTYDYALKPVRAPS